MIQCIVIFHSDGSYNCSRYNFSDVSKIQEGIGDKLSTVIRYSGQFVGGYIIGFIHGWELTLVVTAVSPMIIIAGAIMSQVIYNKVIMVNNI